MRFGWLARTALFFCQLPAVLKPTTEDTKFYRGSSAEKMQQTSLAFLCGFALCVSMLSVVRLLNLAVAASEGTHLKFYWPSLFIRPILFFDSRKRLSPRELCRGSQLFSCRSTQL